ncbi:enoyl-CoA hydratase/isomerase family protein [Bordetella sp. 2513F-2]
MREKPDTNAEAPVLYEVRDGTGLITLNRPAVRNALDDATRQVLVDILDRAGRDPAVRAVVLTGAGKAFCAGGDVRGMQERMQAPPGEVAFNGWSRQQRTHHAVLALHQLPKPVIAAVNGPATGLGADLAFCCDFVLASDTATFAMTYVLRGLIPDGGGMYFLPRRVGLPRAKELIYSGRTVAAQEALGLGMADRLAPPEALLDTALDWARSLSGGSAAALALSKSILDRTFESSVEQIFALGSQAQAICYSTDAHRASVEAFLQARSRKGQA